MRWWWFGPSATRQELDRQLTAMADAGLGGVEVAYVYPLAPATTEFGSEVFLADLRFAAERAWDLDSASTSRLAAAGHLADRTSRPSLPPASCTGTDARWGPNRWR